MRRLATFLLTTTALLPFTLHPSPFPPLTLAQQPANATAAKQALQEGLQLLQQGTAASLRQAIPKFEQAALLARQAGDKAAEAVSLLALGRVYDLLGEKQQALQYYNQSLPLWRAVGDRAGEAITLSSIGVVYDALGEKQQALTFYNQALLLKRAVGDRAGEATTLNNIGTIYNALGEKQQAFAYFNQALLLIRAVGDRSGEATTLNNIGAVYNDLGDKQQALTFFNQALPLWRAVGNRAGEASTLNNIGGVYSNLGDKQQALTFYQQALPLQRAVGNRAGEASTLNNIGRVYSDLGDKQQALTFYQQALPLQRTVGNRAGEAITLNNIGRIYDALGDKQQAISYYNQSLPLSRAVGDRTGEARTLSNIGLVYHALGEKQQALTFYYQALPLWRAVGDRSGEATTLGNISGVYDALGEQKQALTFLNQALLLQRAVGDRNGEATTLTGIGAIYSALGDKQQALTFYNQSLPLSRAVGDRTGEATTLSNIGAVYFALGDKQQVLTFINQALPLYRAVGYKEGEANTLYNFASLKRSQGDLAAALTDIEAAITIIEELRTKIGSQDLRASYFATVQDYYQLKIDLLMQLHQQQPNQSYDAQALHTSERARARSLLEQLTEASLNLKANLDPALAAEEKRLTQALNVADQKRLNLLNSKGYSEADLEAAKAEINTILQQLQTLEAKIRQADPAYANLKYPDPLTLKEMQDKVLDDKTLLLQYALGKERSYLFLVSKTGLKTYQLPPRAEIEAAVEQYRALLLSPNFKDLSQGKALSQLLLGQAASELKGQRLVIVGDGKLQLLPFGALPVPVAANALIPQPLLSKSPSSPSPFSQKGRRGAKLFQSPSPSLGEGFRVRATSQLAERNLGGGQVSQGVTPLLANHEIIALPSVTSLAVQREQWKKRAPAPKTVAVIADPVFKANDVRLGKNATAIVAGGLDQYESLVRNGCGDFDRLPHTETEAQQILALVPNAQRFSALGFDANHAIATSNALRQYRILHLATHGCIQDNPLLSNLALSFFQPDGQKAATSLLKLQDIYNLELNADLVVLSACQTGTGKEVQGEGVVGLTRGFMYAGARRVVVSLWSVNDRATSVLMSDYYQQMLKQGLDPGIALRQAQLAMWRSGQYSAPYYWAAFTMQGDW